jgi:hypothetical protein
MHLSAAAAPIEFRARKSLVRRDFDRPAAIGDACPAVNHCWNDTYRPPSDRDTSEFLPDGDMPAIAARKPRIHAPRQMAQ